MEDPPCSIPIDALVLRPILRCHDFPLSLPQSAPIHFHSDCWYTLLLLSTVLSLFQHSLVIEYVDAACFTFVHVYITKMCMKFVRF